jgi:hypothetical protein
VTRGASNAIIVVSAVLLGNCNCIDPDWRWRDVGVDGGRDASPYDSGRDSALRDAVADEGTDAVAVDGGPTDPGWVALPGLAADCVIERAEHPERLGAFTWTDCGAGCLRAVRGLDHDAVGFGGAFYVEGRGWIASISAAADPHYDLYKIMPIDGVPVAAWRFPHASPNNCSTRGGTVGEGRGAIIAHRVGDSMLTVVDDRIFAAAIDVLGTTDVPLAILGAPDVGNGRTIDGLGLGADAIGIHVSPVAALLVQHAGSLTTVFPTNGWAPAVAGDHVVWAEAGGPWRFWHWTPESGTEIYYDPSDNITGHLLDQGTLVWVRGTDFVGGFATRAELWTSPFARTPAGVAPRLVNSDAGQEYARFADGVYLAVRATGLAFSAQLTDLLDGRVRMLGVPEPGVACSFAHYVSSTEVLLDCGSSALGRLFYRIDPRTLAYRP